MTYNYDTFSSRLYELDNFTGPRTGNRAPDFDLSDTSGAPSRLLDFDGQFLVLELGSITCPLFQSRRGGMAGLVRAFPDVTFKVLYIREAHPGASIPAHGSLAEKQACAHRLESAGKEDRTIVVDDLQGSAHSAYGSYPNAVFIINRTGCVVFFSDWNNPKAIDVALSNLLAGKPAQVKSYFKPALPWVALRTLRQAGKGSLADFLRSLPHLIWANVIRRNIRLWSGRQDTVPPDARC